MCSLLFGTTQLFVFLHPEQQKKSNTVYPEVSFELAQEEIASKAGYDMHADDQSLEAAILNKDLMEVLPGIEEANAISEELEKNVRFEIMLVAPQFLGKSSERTEVKLTDSSFIHDPQSSLLTPIGRRRRKHLICMIATRLKPLIMLIISGLRQIFRRRDWTRVRMDQRNLPQ